MASMAPAHPMTADELFDLPERRSVTTVATFARLHADATRRATVDTHMKSVTIGGEVDRCSVAFMLRSESLDPAVVTAVLKLTPDRAFQKGDLTQATKRYPEVRRKIGLWELRSSLPREVPFDRHLRHLLDQLDPGAEQIKAFVSDGHRADFSCGLFLTRWNRDTTVLPGTVARIAALGAGLFLDIYCGEGDVDVEDDNDGGTG